MITDEKAYCPYVRESKLEREQQEYLKDALNEVSTLESKVRCPDVSFGYKFFVDIWYTDIQMEGALQTGALC